jgi:hypothetical protein
MYVLGIFFTTISSADGCPTSTVSVVAASIEALHLCKFRASFAARTDKELEKTCYDEEGDGEFSKAELLKERLSTYWSV